MISKEQLEQEKAVAMAIPKDQVMPPNTPVVEYIQVAADLIPIYERDKSELKKVNIDKAIPERLEAAIEYLRDTQTNWMEVRKDAEEARVEWNVVYPKAEQLKRDILHTMRFVYDGDSEALARVAEIAEGDNYRDTIQDLHDVAFKGKEDIKRFKGINYEISKFDRADAYSNSLMLLLARMNGEKHNDNESKLLRDQAYTNLKTIVEYLRKYGRYVFRNDAELLEAYSS